MTDHKLVVPKGHRRYIRNGPTPTGKWITDTPLRIEDGDTVSVTTGVVVSPPPPTGVTRTFGPGPLSQLATAIADNTVDAILLRPGTYSGSLTVNAKRSRPVLIRPETAGVIFNGAGSRNCLHFDGAANITLKDITITNYAPTGTGVIVYTNGAHHITLDALTMTGNRLAGGNDQLIYPAGYSAACYDLTIQNSILDGAGGGGCVHLYHAPGAKNVRVLNNTIRNAVWGIIAAAEGATVIATGNTFSGNRYQMLAYVQAPYLAKITASGNNPNDFVTTSGW